MADAAARAADVKSILEKWSPIPRTYDPLKAGSIDGTDTEPHDHGVVRALQAEYHANKLVVGDPKLTLFVGRLNPRTTEDTIKNFFSQYGPLKRYRLVRDIVTGFSKGYAFVEFKDKQDALRAHRDAYKAIIDDKQIFVDFECERVLPGWIPRRLGGGLGGKKESGQLRFGGRDRPFKKPLIITNKENERGSSDQYYGRYKPYERDRYRDWTRGDESNYRHRQEKR